MKPRHPRDLPRGPRRFGAGSDNPFAETSDVASADRPSPSANPFATTAGPAHADPDSPYVPMLADRSQRVLRLGQAGGALALVGLALLGITIALGEWSQAAFLAVPASLASLAVAIPAWTMGRADLRAIRAGAMSDQGRSRLRVGVGIGAFAIAVALLPPILALAALLLNAG